MSLFVDTVFTGHAGSQLAFKIECDALTDDDLDTIAALIARTHTFSRVYGIPRGGLRLAHALEKYVGPEGLTLIVDDVLTSGTSMEEARESFEEETLGVVIFARGPCPSWVRAVFQLSDWAGP